jgi:hypothetical protein
MIRRLSGTIQTADLAHYLHIGRLTIGWGWCRGELPTIFWGCTGNRMLTPGPGFTLRAWRILIGLKLRPA